jgi:hypothetical protein
VPGALAAADASAEATPIKRDQPLSMPLHRRARGLSAAPQQRRPRKASPLQTIPSNAM